MKKYIYISLVIILAFYSCKSTHKVSVSKTGNLEKLQLLKQLKQNQFKALTFESKITISYQDSVQSFNGNGRIRILKDSIIWGSIYFVGIPILKFYITPDRISYYNKLDRTFYEGNFNILKRQLGIEIGFEHLQNLLLGDLIKTVNPQLYQLEQFNKYYLFKSPGNDILNQIIIAPFYKIIKEEIQTRNNLNMTIQYEDYQKINDQHIPGEIKIFTSGHKRILLAYKNITINKQLRFPYRVPQTYRQIQ